jgi:PHD/YefM family antitoxin component YafN of YafNO toxin-antitoxin module
LDLTVPERRHNVIDLYKEQGVPEEAYHIETPGGEKKKRHTPISVIRSMEKETKAKPAAGTLGVGKQMIHVPGMLRTIQEDRDLKGEMLRTPEQRQHSMDEANRVVGVDPEQAHIMGTHLGRGNFAPGSEYADFIIHKTVLDMFRDFISSINKDEKITQQTGKKTNPEEEFTGWYRTDYERIFNPKNLDKLLDSIDQEARSMVERGEDPVIAAVVAFVRQVYYGAYSHGKTQGGIKTLGKKDFQSISKVPGRFTNPEAIGPPLEKLKTIVRNR